MLPRPLNEHEIVVSFPQGCDTNARHERLSDLGWTSTTATDCISADEAGKDAHSGRMYKFLRSGEPENRREGVDETERYGKESIDDREIPLAVRVVETGTILVGVGFKNFVGIVAYLKWKVFSVRPATSKRYSQDSRHI